MYVVYHCTDINRGLTMPKHSFNTDGVSELAVWCRNGIDRKQYEAVAVVDGASLEDVFFLTNHVDTDWTLDQFRILWCKARGRCRSTSVGDYVVDLNTNKTHVVASLGFVEV